MLDPHRLRRAGVALTAGLAIFPASAFAVPVDLGTARPFVVLGGSTVTNTGPSVLNGDLGLAPGTAITGFGGPPNGLVNGVTHLNDAVAAQAQNDLTTAYNVAAAEPVSQDLTGQDLGGKTLNPGTYGFSTSAQLTGALTLDAQGDANAQFVFKIGSTLTTASASSVVLINGASPCNVFWQVGSSATIGSGTAFQGNVLALTSITVATGSTVEGRALARNGAVTLDTNELSNTVCTTGSATPPTTTPTPGTPAPTPGTPAPTPGTPTPTPGTPTPPTATTPGGTTAPPSGAAPGGSATPGGTAGPGTPGAAAPAGTAAPGGAAAPVTQSPTAPPAAQLPPASRSQVPTRNGTATLRPPARRSGGPANACTDGFTARVRGRGIDRVVFRLDGKRIASRNGSPFQVYVKGAAGRHNVTARVTFKDATRARTLSLGYRACASAVLKPLRGPSRFTG